MTTRCVMTYVFVCDDALVIHMYTAQINNRTCGRGMQQKLNNSFLGFGGIIFIIMLFALVLSVTSFAGTSWSTMPSDDGDSRLEEGLWEKCGCSSDVRDDSKLIRNVTFVF